MAQIISAVQFAYALTLTATRLSILMLLRPYLPHSIVSQTTLHGYCLAEALIQPWHILTLIAAPPISTDACACTWPAYAAIVLSILWCLYIVVGAAARCRPLKYQWTRPINDPRHCFSASTFYVTIAAWGIFIDVIIWVLPHPVVWHLHLCRPYKLAITAIFGLGAL